jgi:IclR family transcriptional regulator, KDG regulon repressor
MQRVKVADPSSTATKTLDVLELLAAAGSGLGVSELARRLGSSRTSVARIMAALELKHMVAKDPETKRYRLSLRVLELASQALDQLHIPHVADRHLQELSHRCGEVAHLGVLDGWDVIYVGKAEPSTPVFLRSRVGAREPSHCTSLGKVLLCAHSGESLADYLATYKFERFTPKTIVSPEAFVEHLKQVRRQGFGVDAEEHREGIICVGAPIFGYKGETVAAISVSGPSFRMNDDHVDRLSRLVVETANTISRELGWSPTPKAG